MFSSAVWAHGGSSCQTAVSQWGGMALNMTGPQSHVWTEECSFLTEKPSPLAHYADLRFQAKLAYICDIFSRPNQLNLSLQGRNSNILLVADKVHTFRQRLTLWAKRAEEKRMDMFPLGELPTCEHNRFRKLQWHKLEIASPIYNYISVVIRILHCGHNQDRNPKQTENNPEGCPQWASPPSHQEWTFWCLRSNSSVSLTTEHRK